MTRGRVRPKLLAALASGTLLVCGMPMAFGTVMAFGMLTATGAVAQAPAPLDRPPGPPTSFTLPRPDPGLQAGLEAILFTPAYQTLVQRGRLSVALIDLTNPDQVRFAGWDPDRMRYAASLPKIGILLGVFDQIDKGTIEYTPELKSKLERMIRNSSNTMASEMISLVGFETIAATLRDPRHQLYDPVRRGGIWVGRGYGGLGLWRRDPMGNQSHGATARQAARFFAMVDRGELVSPWASREMKEILSDPRIQHKFVLGLAQERPGSRIFRKSGTWRNFHSDGAIVERDGRKYVAVVLLESRTNSSNGVLASLIVQLDDLIARRPISTGTPTFTGEPISIGGPG